MQRSKRDGDEFLKVYLDRVLPIRLEEPVNTCIHCPGGTPRKWRLNVSGITDGFCPCAGQNGQFILHYATACTWGTEELWEDCGMIADARWVLHRIDGPPAVWRLEAGANDFPISGQIHYELADASFNCNGPNTLSLVSSSGRCLNWPGSLTIEPADPIGTGVC